ncbi:MAG: Methionyl-tRNA synthetase, beta subunit [Parcubacteria group bacterium GW2011_GWB1_46_8]|nr:MAG: Methionyl-tRNA synthetase, beta subunit [Parcubacteria group bacterium GW2011_GWF1_45_5]KKU11605.1 MAG: Methionyl-tRNA synthetase, beta subunit [Parcubacteria group bacterium GW2011_GWA1_45_7]KKU46112.1 MAG: Methionyl-tRNA synthetase, beta subunit [Parcubacteria group bacterium GW2011_GWB1_46_8]KKU47464.1 MAG: Methionyl-tRNA synthetase, beta subunit [Parcubacteria group bacterium GW2011_GWF2_46_8]
MITIEDFSKIEIKVGKVVEASNVEGSEKLIRLIVDFKEDQPRTIFTGVRGYGYVPEDFTGKQFLFVTNLESKKIMEWESQGMILAVDGSEMQIGDKTFLKPLFVSADGLPVGSKVR